MIRRRAHARKSTDVLLVCTGNLCRSPIMHAMLAAQRPDLTIASAGTGAENGEPWHPLAVQALGELDYAIPANAATRRLTRADVTSAKLIITAEGAHRSVVARLDSSAQERTFTLLEAARLSEAAADNRAGTSMQLLAEALHAQLLVQRKEFKDDLADPLNEGLDMFRACAATVGQALQTVFGPAPV